ncbi:MAG: aminopeptidase P N-terminal domain-containing protein [Gammaproteobacteria bacterium]|nr:aminopeptidase P N-terminal domain-containing protein [Gammaproteobacteria bacterium]
MKIGNEFEKRRRYLLDQLGNSSIGVVFAAKEIKRNGEGYYPFRQDSDFFYLTGFTETDAIAVFAPGREEGEYILFNRPHDPELEVWVGPCAGQEGAVRDYGADQSFAIRDAGKIITSIISGRERVFYNAGGHPAFDHRIMNWIKRLESKGRQGVNVPTDLVNIGKITHEMRLRKDEAEIATLKRAADITAAAHLRTMQHCQVGMLEYELEAELMYEFVRGGGQDTAFENIVASGASSCVLHYTENNRRIENGKLVMIDAGVEYNHYAADISRTFPANGKFSEEQKAIYQAVLETQEAVIGMVRPGIAWIDLQHASERLITEKLVALGILQGKVESLVAAGAYKPFYMHRIGHWIGLDDHDVGKYKIGEMWRILEPGMTLTIEPGIYIRDDIPGVDKKWHDIGIRIEDEVLVTEDGYEVLTVGVPKRVGEIEALMANR